MSKATATARTEVSSRYRFFRWVILFLSAAQLLIGLDYITIWPGAEAEFIWESWRTDPPFSLFSTALGGIPQDSEYWLLAFRLPSLIFYAGALLLFYRWGKPLLGRQAVELTLIVGAASLLMPVLAKMAALDIWQWAGTLVFWLAALRYAKGLSNFWLGMMTLGGVWALFNGAYFGLFFLWQIGYSRLFFKGDRSAQVRFAIPLMVMFFVALINFWMAGELSSFQYFDLENWDNLRLLLFAILGILPFIGFTMAGLRDMVYKIRRRGRAGSYRRDRLTGRLPGPLPYVALLTDLPDRQASAKLFSANQLSLAKLGKRRHGPSPDFLCLSRWYWPCWVALRISKRMAFGLFWAVVLLIGCLVSSG